MSLKVKLAEGWCEMAFLESMVAGKLAKPYAEKAAEKVREKVDETKKKVKSKYEDAKDTVGQKMQEAGGKLRKETSKSKSGSVPPLPEQEKKSGSLPKFESLMGFKKGGIVSSVSKRADGIAKRGRTKCKVC